MNIIHRAILFSVAVTGTSATLFAQFTPGSPGVGDPLFPQAGNGGYDVQHYSLTLDYEPSTNHLAGVAEIRATATQGLSSFNLDLRGFEITRLEVDGGTATFEREGQELIVTPEQGIEDGSEFEVRVDYAGTPVVVVDPDGLIEGWIPTKDGAFVVGQPQGSPAWYPANDTPRDKATFDFSVTVPAGLTVMANGVLLSSDTAAGRTTWVWREDSPMAPYLATVSLGRYELTQYELASGTPVYVAVDPHLGSEKVLDHLPDMLEFFESIFGPYPFDAAGAIVDKARFVGYALETQTKPIFDRMPDEATLAHELAHMWHGDSVTLVEWTDIWLHEGFATWAEWAWSEHTGGKTADQLFHRAYAKSAHVDKIWDPPAAALEGPEQLFANSVYVRGAMTVQALRMTVGEQAFFQILADWTSIYRHANATTADFIALSENVSGMDLGAFFDAWLHQPGKPAGW